MKFTLELEHVLVRFRLQSDGSWRDISNDGALRLSDSTFVRPSEITERCRSLTSVEINGIIYEIDPGQTGPGQKTLHATASVFRNQFPQDPTIEQCRDIMAAGDDTVTNSLILNVDGVFELRACPPFDPFNNDPTIVVRHESFGSGNDYVGPRASRDTRHVESHFGSSLGFWVSHLKTHRTQILLRDVPETPLSRIYNELNSIRGAWKPDY